MMNDPTQDDRGTTRDQQNWRKRLDLGRMYSTGAACGCTPDRLCYAHTQRAELVMQHWGNTIIPKAKPSEQLSPQHQPVTFAQMEAFVLGAIALAQLPPKTQPGEQIRPQLMEDMYGQE